jgi:hypothetical protein
MQGFAAQIKEGRVVLSAACESVVPSVVDLIVLVGTKKNKNKK